ncbi:TPA: hypothetical protein ACGO84_001917, partial [Streptococcus suis]
NIYLSIAIQSIDSKLMISLLLKNSIEIQVAFFTEIEKTNKKFIIFQPRSSYNSLLLSLSGYK